MSDFHGRRIKTGRQKLQRANAILSRVYYPRKRRGGRNFTRAGARRHLRSFATPLSVPGDDNARN